MADAPARKPRSLGGAVAVGAGIFVSKIAGLVRDRAFSHYLGISAAADAFGAALRIPNLLQNLFGEGVLSASFIPVYTRLLAEGRTEEASRVARAVGTLLALIASGIALVGVIAAGPLVDLLVPGFEGSKRELTVTLVRVLFPGVALLVLSAWCLGVLNSHRRFFLSYASPVLWNVAMITTAIVAGRRLAGHDDNIAYWLAIGAVIGSAAQFLVQVPTVVSLLRGFTPSLAVNDPGVRQTISRFMPIVVGRGSAQLSGYIDQLIASYLGKGIVAAMARAQTLYMLPVSLFGMAISASELTEMSAIVGTDDSRAARLQQQLRGSLRRVVFFVVPSAVAFVAIGGRMIAMLFQSGRFTAQDTVIVWTILAGSALGLSAGTQSRLLSSAFYALGDPRPPRDAALVRLALTSLLGWALALPLREKFGYSSTWGAFGLTASAGFAAWIEFLLLDRWLGNRIGKVPVPTRLGFGALAAAMLAGAAAYGVAHIVAAHVRHPWMVAPVAIPVFGGIYLGIMVAARVPETRALTRLLRR